jgi:hypothetical protein
MPTGLPLVTLDLLLSLNQRQTLGFVQDPERQPWDVDAR